MPFHSADFWYLVGLIATDGSLSRDGRHIDITSKDQEFLIQLCARFGFSNRVGKKRNGRNGVQYRIQIADRALYCELEKLGLFPAKSLRLGKLLVDDSYFHDFFRGIIDGDGSIRQWQHPTNGCLQWSLRIYSAAPKFIGWLRDEVEQRFGCAGKIHAERKTLYILKFGKIAAQAILGSCYYRDAFCLERKRLLAQNCASATTYWRNSKTFGQVAEWQTLRTQLRVSPAATLG